MEVKCDTNAAAGRPHMSAAPPAVVSLSRTIVSCGSDAVELEMFSHWNPLVEP